MKKFIPYALSLIFLAFPTQKAWADDRAKLVQIYCQSLLESDTKGREPHALNWTDLQTRLERRRLEAKKDSEAIRKCLREHEDDFEAAELILTGKEAVQESLQEKRIPIAEETTQVDVSGVIMEIKKSVAYSMNEKEIAREARQRAERYAQMWQRFLNGLKRKTSERLSLR